MGTVRGAGASAVVGLLRLGDPGLGTCRAEGRGARGLLEQEGPVGGHWGCGLAAAWTAGAPAPGGGDGVAAPQSGSGRRPLGGRGGLSQTWITRTRGRIPYFQGCIKTLESIGRKKNQWKRAQTPAVATQPRGR